MFHKVSVGWSSRCLVHLLSDELILTEAVQNIYCPLNSTPSEFNMLSYLFSQSKCPQSCFIFWARTHTSERAGICSVMCRHLLIHIYGPGCMHGDIIVLRQGSCYQILQAHFVCPKYHQTTRLIWAKGQAQTIKPSLYQGVDSVFTYFRSEFYMCTTTTFWEKRFCLLAESFRKRHHSHVCTLNKEVPLAAG